MDHTDDTDGTDDTDDGWPDAGIRDVLGARRRGTGTQGRPDPPTLPGYEVGRVLGSGSSGRVWRAVRRDGLTVAVKVVEARGGDLTPAMREAAALSRVQHEHVVRLHDVLPLPPREPGSGHRLALVMQLAEGGSLARVVRDRGHLTPGEVVTVLCPLASALHALHRQGVVHGDVAPSNVLFLDTGRPVLADLGVCRVAGDPDRAPEGTLGMVAPEVLEGWPPTPAADVYGVGALAWHALTGQHPGWGIERRALADVLPDVAGTPLEAVVEAALDSDPDRRPEADELAARLYAAARAEPLALAPELGEGRGLTRRLRPRAARAVPHGGDDVGSRRRRRLLAGVGGGSAVLLVVAALALWPRGGSDEQPREEPVPPPAAATAAPTTPAPAPAPDPPPAAVRLPLPQPASTTPSPDAASVTSAPPVGWEPTATRERLQELVDARAAAWESADPADLLVVHAPGSPALEQDAGALAQARSEGLRYDGLSFAVERAQVGPERGGGETEEWADGERPGGEVVVVDAVLRRSGYTVRRADEDPGAGDDVAATEAEGVVLELVRTDDGWRVWSWR